MNARHRGLGLLLGAVIAAHGLSAWADGGDAVVAKIGAVTVTRAELERRLARIPMIQLSTFGQDAASMKRAFLDKVVIPEILMSEGAKASSLVSRSDVRMKLLDAERSALLADIRTHQSDPATGVSDADVAAYYEQNKDKFQTPERLNLWRILCKTKDDAQKVLAELKKPGGEKKWSELAREKSVDTATRERGGNLGFVAADGKSNEVTVKVDPALFAAAKKVENGEMVPQPVPEGDEHAVVWRRGGTPAVSRTLEQEKNTIRVTLVRQRVEAEQKELLEKLRKEQVKDLSYDLLTAVDVSPPSSSARGARPPMARPALSARPQPNGGR